MYRICLNCHNYFVKLRVIKKTNLSMKSFYFLENKLQFQNKFFNITYGGVSFIHTTRPLGVNPLILLIAKPLSKLSVILVGRGFRKWWQSLPKNKKVLIFSHMHTNNWKYLASLATMFGTAYALYETHTAISPFSGRKKFLLLDNSQITEISDYNFKDEMEQFQDHILPHHHPKVISLKRICQKIFQGNPNIPQLHSKFWTLFVVDSTEENCIVYPSGQIVMFTGMMELTDNENQLAIVLAHEMSHVILEHHIERLSHASLVDLLILVPLAIIWAVLPNDGIAAVTHWFFNKVVNLIVSLPFSRTLETEADSLGLLLAASACFDIREASAFWGRLDILDNMRNKKELKLDHIKYLSTHPSHADRQSHLDELMKSALDARESQKCPKLNNIDPRTSVKILQEQLKQTAAIASQ